MEPRDITCVYIGRVGDLIVATPLLRAVRRRHPKARVRLVVSWRARQVLPLVPFVDSSAILGKTWDLPGHGRLLWELATGPCDLLVDLNSSFSKTASGLIAITRAPERVGFDKGRGPSPFTREIPPPAEREHMADRYARLAEALDAPYDPGLEVRAPKADEDEAVRLLSGLPAARAGAFKLVIHPGNFDRFSFRWPEEKFVALADSLLDDPRLDVRFMGGPGERAKVEAIVNSLKRPVPILPESRLGVCGAMLKAHDLLLCNITGTTHLAAALAVPTFGLYAGYTQAVWRPRGARHGGTVCPEWESCRETPVDEVRSSLLAHIERLRG